MEQVVLINVVFIILSVLHVVAIFLTNKRRKVFIRSFQSMALVCFIFLIYYLYTWLK